MIALDQLTKYLATTYLEPIGRSPFIPGVELVYVVNDGVAFSLFSGSWFFVLALPIVTIIVLLVMLFLGKLGGGFYDFCFVMIIAGGIGNIIDRILYGHVVDFFNFTFINFAVFNVADCFITVGVALYAIKLVVQEFKNRKKNAPQQEQETKAEISETKEDGVDTD